MSERPRKEKMPAHDRATGLKTHSKESHNQTLADEQLIQLIKLMARRAAEADFKAPLPYHLDQGGNNHDTTH
ncbi:MAG: hypothetical protein KME56_12430 [Candidatus Thiodiazotropha sp. (ex Ctena orbiculata)]|nr:hypothetical protein [Candidatus Thiodiazotropha taylori]MBV2107495.1 hypothetical protein [Candidatus Thiodiazotropha taylori]MBV2111948.1 hypothetical protein [Candidatus Thiodiazotropha taylori]